MAHQTKIDRPQLVELLRLTDALQSEPLKGKIPTSQLGTRLRWHLGSKRLTETGLRSLSERGLSIIIRDRAQTMKDEQGLVSG